MNCDQGISIILGFETVNEFVKAVKEIYILGSTGTRTSKTCGPKKPQLCILNSFIKLEGIWIIKESK